MSTQRKKSAPTRSILFTKQNRGTSYLLAWRHTVSVCGSTPATASKTATAPSSTRSDRSTSTVKYCNTLVEEGHSSDPIVTLASCDWLLRLGAPPRARFLPAVVRERLVRL